MFTEIGNSESNENHLARFAGQETFFSVTESDARIRIVALGIGGMGQNAMENLAFENVDGLEIYSINTDMQALSKCVGSQAVQIGKQRTCGRGAGGDSEIGRLSAEDDIDTLRDIVSGAELVFIAAGMGGGTGTGAAPVIGRICREMGIMNIGVVTTPMHYEGPKRMEKAKSGLSAMRRMADSLMVVENEKLSTIMNEEDISIINAFRKADGVLVNALKSITRIINLHGYINLDLADLNNVLKRQSDDTCSDILIGVGEARGDNRASRAAQNALNNPLLSNSNINGSVNLLVNVAGNEEMGLQEALSAIQIIEDKAGEMDREIFMGVVADNSLGDVLSVTVIANGLGTLKKSSKEQQSVKIGAISEKHHGKIAKDTFPENQINNGWMENIATNSVKKECFGSEADQCEKDTKEGTFAAVPNTSESFMFMDRGKPVKTIIELASASESTAEIKMNTMSGRERFVKAEKRADFGCSDEFGRSPVIDKAIWKTPAGIRRQLLIQQKEITGEKVVKFDNKTKEGWRSRVLDDERQASLLNHGVQTACS